MDGMAGKYMSVASIGITTKTINSGSKNWVSVSE
jgi:hypothetical protein